MMRVSAFSCEHGWMLDNSSTGPLFDVTPAPFVETISFSGDMVAVRSARNWNSSVLLSDERRKLGQFPGMGVFSLTRLLVPFPLFSLVWLFNESGRYLKQYNQ